MGIASSLRATRDKKNPGSCREESEVKVKPHSSTYEVGLAIKLRPKSSGGEVLIKDSKSQSQSNTDRLAGRADEDDL